MAYWKFFFIRRLLERGQLQRALERLQADKSLHVKHQYWHLLALVHLKQENFAASADACEKACTNRDAGYARFSLYSHWIGCTLARGDTRRASDILRNAIIDFQHAAAKPRLGPVAIHHLLIFARRFNFFLEYKSLLLYNFPLFFSEARKKLQHRISTMDQWGALRENDTFFTRFSKDGEDYFSAKNQTELIVEIPYELIKKIVSRDDKTSELYLNIFHCLRQLGVPFTLRTQFILNIPVDSDPRPKLLWHTRGNSPRVRHLKESYLPGYFYFDKYGYSGWAEISTLTSEKLEETLNLIPHQEAHDFFTNLQASFLKGRVSKYTQTKKHAVRNYKYIFIPLQLIDDQVTKLTDWNIYKLVEHVLSLTTGSEYRVVIKRHPKCKNSQTTAFLKRIARNQRVEAVDESIHSLIESASAVCTVNSGVGFEALLALKPVFIASPSDYAYLASDIRGVQTLDTFIRLINTPPDKLRHARFMTHYCRDYLINSGDLPRIKSKIVDFLKVFKDSVDDNSRS